MQELVYMGVTISRYQSTNLVPIEQITHSAITAEHRQLLGSYEDLCAIVKVVRQTNPRGIFQDVEPVHRLPQTLVEKLNTIAAQHRSNDERIHQLEAELEVLKNQQKALCAETHKELKPFSP